MAMIKKLLFTLSLCMLAGSVLYAQSTIKGVVKGPDGAAVPFLQILLKQDGRVLNGAYTDDQGNYSTFGIQAGTYDLTAGGTFICPSLHTQTGIYVSSSEVKFVDLVVNCASTELEEVVVEYVPPIFSQDNTTSSSKLTGDEVRKTPGRSITAALSNLDGVASVDGSMTAVRGNRSDGQVTMIDGVRVRGTGGVPMQAVEGAELIQGGIPAEFGDGTSFAIITTRGIAKDYHGSVGLRSSIEGYGQMVAEANISGPLLKGKNPQDPPRMGFFLAAEGSYDIDNRPLRGGSWVAKPEVIRDIINNPIEYRYSPGGYTPYYRANDLGSDAFKKIRTRQNAQDWGFIASGKIDIMGGGKDARGRARNNLRFSIGGSYEYQEQLGWGTRMSLFNSSNNGVVVRNTLRLNARINHRVKTDTAANAILKNIMYDINVNYTLYNGKSQDRNHKDNIFGYGYIGKFNTERTDFYQWEMMQVYNPFLRKDTTMLALKLTNYQAVNWVTFDKDGYLNNGNYFNPDFIPYTQNFIEFIKEKTGIDINNASEIDRNTIRQFLGGANLSMEMYEVYQALLNGATPDMIANGLYYSPGLNIGEYAKARDEAIGARASLSLNIKDHDVKFGFEFEKMTRRSYSIAATRLWGRMRELTYDAGQFPFDLANPYWQLGGNSPMFDPTGQYIIDTLMYPIMTNLSNFDLNLRAHRGIDNTKEFLDIDSYDPNDFSLDLFSNYELFRGGVRPLVGYYGYDYTGAISNKRMSLSNFFSGGDLHEKDKYAIGAFEPVYLAIYLQDKFSISNLLFNVGLRLDYFNANQPVLKDPFLLRDAYSVGDLRNSNVDVWRNFAFPDNATGTWIPYVSSADNDLGNAPVSGVVAYRDGKIWYNNRGQEITDPSGYLGTGGPILREALDPEAPSKASSDAFTMYKPQWSLMPRISFSFPVSTNSLFYAHYNIITYRPTNNIVDPIAYLFITNNQSPNDIITNPNLRAQRTVDYEIGFRQKVGENAALRIAAYYSEKRDLIQSYRFTGAYPNTYYSYENQDFGTVQGYVLGLEMRGTKNLSFRVSYTLQFAKGTGSSPGSNLALIASQQPNLRTLVNLSDDQRHNISGLIDLRFHSGTNYNGPVTVKQKKGTDTKKEIRWLENSGVTLMASAASGMPYSRSAIVYSVYGWGERRAGQLKGSINGANMPWIFTCDMRVDKSFFLNLASKKQTEGVKRKNKPSILMVYLDFQNLFNIKNVTSVYDYTGSPSDDGYLASSLFYSQVSRGTAFGMPVDAAMNYYEMLIANPLNFTRPFRVHLGVSFSF